jgi:hypothetical protein
VNLRKVFIGATAGLLAVTALAGITVGTPSGSSEASSHRESPLLLGDPLADATDLYAFVSPDAPDTVTLIANWVPLEEPADGPNFYQFGNAPNYVYGIKIDNDGDAVPDIGFEWRFKAETQNPGTFLYNTGPITSLTDPDFNMRQSYTLTRVDYGDNGKQGKLTVLGSGLPTPPVAIGPRSAPDYDSLVQEAIQTLPGGYRVFAGQRDDPFFVDLGSITDVLALRNPGSDTVSGYNTHSVVIQAPKSAFTSAACNPADAADATNGECVIGIWSTTDRPSVSVLGEGKSKSSGKGVQVSRLGNPLVNEVVIPVGQKDAFNAAQPAADAQFASYVTDPELAKLLNIIYNGILTPIPESNRSDLVTVFLTGVPTLTQPPNVVPSEQLRLNVTVPPAADPNPLGVLAGDFQGYPNGRRLTDDVTDIALRAVACGYGAVYTVFDPFGPCDSATFGSSPNNSAAVSDNVDENDVPFSGTFPYLANPQSGFDHGHAHSDISNSILPAGMGILGLLLGLAIAWPKISRLLIRRRALVQDN